PCAQYLIKYLRIIRIYIGTPGRRQSNKKSFLKPKRIFGKGRTVTIVHKIQWIKGDRNRYSNILIAFPILTLERLKQHTGMKFQPVSFEPRPIMGRNVQDRLRRPGGLRLAGAGMVA